MLKIHVSYVPAPSLHNHVSIKSLYDMFSSPKTLFSKNKTSLIQSAFPDHSLNHAQVDSPQVNSLLACFIPVTVDEAREIITFPHSNKSCDLDLLHITLQKACLDTLLYSIINIVNASM